MSDKHDDDNEQPVYNPFAESLNLTRYTSSGKPVTVGPDKNHDRNNKPTTEAFIKLHHLRRRQRRTHHRHTMLQASVPIPDKVFIENIAIKRRIPLSWVVSEALEKGLAVMKLEDESLEELDCAHRGEDYGV